MERTNYETYVKLDNGKWYFVGWFPMPQEENFCVLTVNNDKSIVKTYKWLNGETTVYKFMKNEEEGTK